MQNLFNFDELAKKWPSAIVARTEVAVFSGGTISEKYLANLDSVGKGPTGRFRLGRKVVYPVKNLVIWLQGRSSKIKSCHEHES